MIYDILSHSFRKRLHTFEWVNEFFDCTGVKIRLIVLKQAIIFKEILLNIMSIIFEEFCRYAGPMGIKISTWINAKMKEFVDDQKMLEEIKRNRNK